jgi:peptidoglycan biosynthesis protein MviN/MurJ (putative lipid II flippase)
MDKNTIYIIVTILKTIIIIVGMPFLILDLISWFKTKDNKKIKRAAVIIVGIFILLVMLTGLEFIIAYN